jgi:hypothetical protein
MMIGMPPMMPNFPQDKPMVMPGYPMQPNPIGADFNQ